MRENLINNEDILPITHPDEWEKWLSSNADRKTGIWLRIAKKQSRKKSIELSDAQDIALCYGWIDSQRKGFDNDFYLQRYSRRSKKSPWSKLNRERAQKLIEDNRMTAAGFREIDTARSDGRWEVAYESQKAFSIPKDFLDRLDTHRAAKAAFSKLRKTEQYLLLLPLLKTVNTTRRENELNKIVGKLLSK